MNKIKGGKVVDSGGYGCLFVPPLKCKGDNPNTKNIITIIIFKYILTGIFIKIRQDII